MSASRFMTPSPARVPCRRRFGPPNAWGAPKSQPLRRLPECTLRRQFLSFAQELEEFDAFARAAPEHVPVRQHLAHDRRDLSRAEIEALVEDLERIEDFLVAQMR